MSERDVRVRRGVVLTRAIRRGDLPFAQVAIEDSQAWRLPGGHPLGLIAIRSRRPPQSPPTWSDPDLHVPTDPLAEEDSSATDGVSAFLIQSVRSALKKRSLRTRR